MCGVILDGFICLCLDVSVFHFFVVWEARLNQSIVLFTINLFISVRRVGFGAIPIPRWPINWNSVTPNAAAGIIGKPTVGIRDDAFEPPGMGLRRVGVRLPRCRLATTTQRELLLFWPTSMATAGACGCHCARHLLDWWHG